MQRLISTRLHCRFPAHSGLKRLSATIIRYGTGEQKEAEFCPASSAINSGCTRLVAVLADCVSATSLEEVEVGAGIGPFDMLLMQEGIA